MNEHETPTNQVFLEKKVKMPAIFLIITAGIGMLFGVISILMSLLGMGTMDTYQTPELEKFAPFMTGGFSILLNCIGLLIGVFIIFASMKMMKMQSWGLAMTAAIIAMVPCISPCCILGIPFGIWAIVALSNSDVKAAFK